MAQKRMFDKTITNSDKFLEMPTSTQNLYFHLSMNADDDGFVDNWKSIIKISGAKEDDLKILIAKSYVIPFESGVIVIKHWRINNFLRKDRHVDTRYIEEMNQLEIATNNEYNLKGDVNVWLTNGKPRREEKRREEKRIDNSFLVEQIIAFMNELAGTSFSSKTKKTKSLINARLAEGFTIEDFKDVINYKYYEWYKNPITFNNGVKSDKYYRPNTLFSTKFEEYLEQYKKEYKEHYDGHL